MSGATEPDEPVDRGEDEAQDVEALIARRRAAPRRGTPEGREPAVGARRLRWLVALTVGLILASALLLVAALALG